MSSTRRRCFLVSAVMCANLSRGRGSLAPLLSHATRQPAVLGCAFHGPVERLDDLCRVGDSWLAPQTGKVGGEGLRSSPLPSWAEGQRSRSRESDHKRLYLGG